MSDARTLYNTDPTSTATIRRPAQDSAQHRTGRSEGGRRLFPGWALAVVMFAALAAAGCTNGDPAATTQATDTPATDTTAAVVDGTPVAFDFTYDTVPGGNTTEAIDDGGELRFGNINFAGDGTLDGDPVDVSVQAHVLFLDGSGPSGGSVAVTDANGDVLVLELDSRATRVGDGARIDGTFTVVGGTGRFADVEGAGTGTGERNAALGAGVRWSVDLRLTGI